MEHQPSLGSDNHSGVHPKVLEALVSSNKGSAPSYGMDHWSRELKELLETQLGCLDSHIVFNGTAANVLSVACALKSYESVICSDIAHLHIDECGAPEKFFGGKVITVPHQLGKISPESIEKQIIRKGDQHFSQAKMVSITQPTEYGTCYTIDELKSIKALCTKENLFLHIDGARLGNAAHYLNCSLEDILSLADVATIGGSKNGLLVGDLVLIYNNQLTEGFKFLRKQALQLPSKSRFIACQFIAYFTNNLWKEISAHQCSMASYLATELKNSHIEVTQPVNSNAVFCILPKEIIKKLKKTFFFYVWDEHTFECRLMTSFDTQKYDLDLFIKKLNTLRGDL